MPGKNVWPYSRTGSIGGYRKMKKLVLALTLSLAATALCAQSLAGFIAPYNAVSPRLPGGGTWILPVVYENAGFVKLHLSSIALAEGEKISLYAGGPSSKAVYELKGPYSGEAWLPSVDGMAAFVVMTSKGAASFEVDKAGIGFKERTPERICGNDDRQDAACFDASYRGVGDKVGRILFVANGTLHYCTGFLVSSDGLFATNQHCIYDSETAATAEVRWKYEKTACGGGTETFDSVSAGCLLVMADPRTDLALMRFSSDNPAARYGYLPLDDRAVEKDETIWIPQHSEGGPKVFAVHSDSDGGATVIAKSLAGVSASQAIGYNLDTEAGSSGSPVMDNNNKVIGIHTFTALNDGCASPDLNKGMKMEVLYPLIQPYVSSCSGNPPVITALKYVAKDRSFKLNGNGFTENCVIMVDGVVQITKLKKNGKLVAAMFTKLLRGDTATVRVFDKDTGCTSDEVVYTRPW